MDIRKGDDIASSIAQEHRPAEQIGSDVDYNRVTRGVSLLLLGVIALVAALLALSFVVKIDELARARGEFIPVQRTQVIQTPEGGAISSMLVHNDERVVKGQLIAKFRATDLLRDIERSRSRMGYLQIQMEGLDAFASQRKPDFTPFGQEYATQVAEAQSLYGGQVRELNSNLEQVNRQIDEEKAALAASEDQSPFAKSSLDASQELFARTKDGVDRGVIAKNRLAEVEEQTAQRQRVYSQLTTSIDQHAVAIKRIEAQREAIIAKATADARKQRADLLEQVSELKATQEAYASRSGDIEVRAPVNGIVQKISETPIGTVITAGGTVCEIVPTDGGVLMQAHVLPRDIGFIRVGEKANVKSDAFDYSRFGEIPGRVVRIAAQNTQASQSQSPYIVVEIELDQPYVGTDKTHVVTPGMTGEATILTGEKTIFQYLLKPIYYTLDTAFRER